MSGNLSADDLLLQRIYRWDASGLKLFSSHNPMAAARSEMDLGPIRGRDPSHCSLAESAGLGTGKPRCHPLP
jgi:hypothetical protein